VLLRQLKRVGDQDYFERGIELAIEQDRIRIEPVDISDLYAVEIDFAKTSSARTSSSSAGGLGSSRAHQLTSIAGEISTGSIHRISTESIPQRETIR
jgi:hypothetical protein